MNLEGQLPLSRPERYAIYSCINQHDATWVKRKEEERMTDVGDVVCRVQVDSVPARGHYAVARSGLV
jgi:hypothetical protein